MGGGGAKNKRKKEEKDGGEGRGERKMGRRRLSRRWRAFAGRKARTGERGGRCRARQMLLHVGEHLTAPQGLCKVSA